MKEVCPPKQDYGKSKRIKKELKKKGLSHKIKIRIVKIE